MSERAKRPKLPTVIRRGDVWDETCNHGHIFRHVRSVACGVVSYLCNGRLYRCQFETFQQWARGADLFAADDWEGRTKCGRYVETPEASR